MPHFYGEYDCKVDSKGRVRLPSGLTDQVMRQIGGEGTMQFIINRGLGDYLAFHPRSVFEAKAKELESLNEFDETTREFVRQFFRGATLVEVDSSDRILIKKNLLDYAGITKELIIVAVMDGYEVWSKQKYDDSVNNFTPDQIKALSQQVLGNKNKPSENDVS